MLPASDAPIGPRPCSTASRRRLVDLLRLRQRTAQNPGLVTGMEPAGQVGVDRREEALAAAAWPMPEGQGGPLEHLPGEHVQRGGMALGRPPVPGTRTPVKARTHRSRSARFVGLGSRARSIPSIARRLFSAATE